MEETSTITVSSPLPNRNSANGVNATNIPEFRQGPTTRLSLSSQDPIKVSAEESGVPSSGLRKTVSILAIAPTRTQLPCEATGATVFVGGSGTSSVSAVANTTANAPANWTQTSIPEVQTVNGYGTRRQDHQKESQQQQLHTVPTVHTTSSHQRQSSQPHHTAQHVVKIRINPELDTSRVVSTIRLNPEPDDSSPNSSVNKSYREENGTYVEGHDNPIDGEFRTRREDATRLSVRGLEASSVQADSRVRISVVSGNVTNDQRNEDQRDDARTNDDRSVNPPLGENHESERHQDEMLQRQRMITNDAISTSLSRSSGSLYFGSFPNSLTTMMTSGQCSPSDTLDSGTCSDLDGTPPPLPKKKNSSTVLLGINASNGDSPKIGKVTPGSQQSRHNRAGSVTSSGPELDSDDNESNISCDSLNGAELASRIAEHSIRVNGVALIEVDDKTEKAPSCDNNSSNGVVEIARVTGNDANGHNAVGDGRECHKVNDHDDTTCDVKNNNNNDELSNNNEPEIANGTKVNGDRQMNERNNGNVEATDPAILSTELISASSSFSSPTSGPSPSVSPSPSGASSLSKASSTPRVRSPVSNGHSSPVQSSPMIKECTYEERKREQDRINEENAAADYYANYNRKNGTKYLYDDDRFYKFHINENQSDNENENEAKIAERESDEFFAGYKILDREAIRSAKGTVRGVKNRVRAGIATFLQKPTAKNYKTMEAGRIVVYVTTMSIVRKTFNSCLTMLNFLKTHMVEHEVRDLFMSRELQTELKERIGSESVDVPQLFIDGQHIGNADVVERLNESGELRDMFKPYKSPNARTTCKTCGGCRLRPCPVCNGSKKSPVRNDFMKEFYYLRCMNCDEVGLVRCQYC